MTFSPGFPSAHPGQLNRKAHRSPLHRHTRDASTPAQGATLRFGLRGATPEVAFRPCGFAPLRRFPPHRGPRACCIPQPVLGFATFPPSRRRPKVGGVRAFPSRRTYPSKESPSDSRTASPRPLPPCRWYLRAFPARTTPLPEWRLRGRWAQDLDFEALLRRRVPARPASLPMRTRPVLPGLVSPSRSFVSGRRSRLPPSPWPAPPEGGGSTANSVRHPSTPEAEARSERAETRGEPRDKGHRARRGPTPGAGADRRARRRGGRHSTVHRRRPKPPSAPRIGTRAPKRARGNRFGRNPFESSQRGECTARRDRSRSCMPARQRTTSKLAVVGHLCRRSLSGVEVREVNRGLSSGFPPVRRRCPRRPSWGS